MKEASNVYTTLGSSNHCIHEREKFDYYATDPVAAEWLLKLEPELDNIWEPACGEGNLAKVFDKYGKLGKASDLINRGYGEQLDFFRYNDIWDGDIVTNPPYNQAEKFILKALNSVKEGRKVCLFLKLTFLEGKTRKKMFETFPPKNLYVSSSRIVCALNNKFEFTDKDGKIKKIGSAIAYGWYVWEKGYTGDTTIKWFN